MARWASPATSIACCFFSLISFHSGQTTRRCHPQAVTGRSAGAVSSRPTGTPVAMGLLSAGDVLAHGGPMHAHLQPRPAGGRGRTSDRETERPTDLVLLLLAGCRLVGFSVFEREAPRGSILSPVRAIKIHRQPATSKPLSRVGPCLRRPDLSAVDSAGAGAVCCPRARLLPAGRVRRRLDYSRCTMVVQGAQRQSRVARQKRDMEEWRYDISSAGGRAAL